MLLLLTLSSSLCAFKSVCVSPLVCDMSLCVAPLCLCLQVCVPSSQSVFCLRLFCVMSVSCFITCLCPPVSLCFVFVFSDQRLYVSVFVFSCVSVFKLVCTLSSVIFYSVQLLCSALSLFQLSLYLFFLRSEQCTNCCISIYVIVRMEKKGLELCSQMMETQNESFVSSRCKVCAWCV